MKKYLLLLAAFGFFLFTSCSDDDDDNGGETPSITATWELTGVNPTVPGWDFSACEENPEITFNADGTANWTLYDSENDCAEVNDTGTWEKNSDTNYTVEIPGVGEFDGTVAFSGENMFTFTTLVQTFPITFTFQK